MNNQTLRIIVQFIFIYLIQVAIFNQIEIGSYLKFYPYIAFVLIYPLRKNRLGLLISSFCLGLLIDFSTGSGGINAMTLLFTAYIRLPLLKFVMNNNDLDYPSFNLRQIPIDKALLFMAIICLVHCLVLYSLSYFSFVYLIPIILKGLISGSVSFLLILVGIYTFTKPRV